jgi:hypothetical protein
MLGGSPTVRCGTDAKNKLIFLSKFSAYYFLKVHLHHFSKIKSPKEDKKLGMRIFLQFLLDDRRIRIHTSK